MAVDTSSLPGLHTERWELSGSFRHPHWLAFLSTALADVGISVVQGHAARGERGVWEGYLEAPAKGPYGLRISTSRRLQRPGPSGSIRARPG